jgi:NAD(P)-dependent dehydrogenase (short-subunit alcohol dehydrogenase family)
MPEVREEIMSVDWTRDDIPDQSGRLAIITGANSGIGLETARELARRSAHVVLACRSQPRAEAAIEDIRAELPEAGVEFMRLDLEDLDQVREFAASVHERFDRLDLLINNAGVMVPPEGRTLQGFELQIGVNHLAHFALTGLLLDLLLATEGARVVNVSSQAHRFGKMDFDDLDFEGRGYNARAAYGQSKLANLLFTYELVRRLQAADVDLLVAAAHPGWTQTNLQKHSSLFQLLNPLFGMQPPGGALPTLRAATAADVRPGDYYGPKGFYEMRGAPTKVNPAEAARSRTDAERLWKVSEERTGAHFDFERAATQA